MTAKKNQPTKGTTTTAKKNQPTKATTTTAKKNQPTKATTTTAKKNQPKEGCAKLRRANRITELVINDIPPLGVHSEEFWYHENEMTKHLKAMEKIIRKLTAKP